MSWNTNFYNSLLVSSQILNLNEATVPLKPRQHDCCTEFHVHNDFVVYFNPVPQCTKRISYRPGFGDSRFVKWATQTTFLKPHLTWIVSSRNITLYNRKCT
jgi:hypothetical protein